MPLPSTVSNGVKAYNLSAAKISPKWETAKSEKNRVEEPDRENSIELLQDFSFPSSTTLIRISEDNGHLVTAGTYKPQIKAFELSQLSLKFERHLEEETVDFRILSEDYSKLCFLRRDRFLEFHTQFGSHYKTKLPQNGRNMIFNRFNCDLLIASSRKEVYRLNLEEGRFKKSITTDLELNHGALHDKLRFYAFGGEDHVACFDERSNGEIASFEVQKSLENGSETVNGIRRIAFDKSGASNDLLMAVGTGSGRTLVYDIRMKKPLFAKDHRNERPIVDLSFHSSDKFVSADQNGIKFWDCKTGKIFTTIIPSTDINSFCLSPNSGIVFAACDEPKTQTFFLPQLGEAPSWCSFLDNITEELEEQPSKTVYDDYKFVTKEDLEKLDAKTLFGTDALKPYMHGYFINYRLYARLKATVSQSEMREHLRSNRREKIANKINERIASLRRVAKSEDSLTEKENKKNEFKDDRFRKMFEDADYHIDVRSEEYQLRHSSNLAKNLKMQKKQN